jgi:hypothetical protein
MKFVLVFGRCVFVLGNESFLKDLYLVKCLSLILSYLKIALVGFTTCLFESDVEKSKRQSNVFGGQRVGVGDLINMKRRAVINGNQNVGKGEVINFKRNAEGVKRQSEVSGGQKVGVGDLINMKRRAVINGNQSVDKGEVINITKSLLVQGKQIFGNSSNLLHDSKPDANGKSVSVRKARKVIVNGNQLVGLGSIISSFDNLILSGKQEVGIGSVGNLTFKNPNMAEIVKVNPSFGLAQIPGLTVINM